MMLQQKIFSRSRSGIFFQFCVLLLAQTALIADARNFHDGPLIDSELKCSLAKWSHEADDSHREWVNIDLSDDNEDTLRALENHHAQLFIVGQQMTVWIPAQDISGLRKIKQVRKIRLHNPKEPVVIDVSNCGLGKSRRRHTSPTFPIGPIPDNE